MSQKSSLRARRFHSGSRALRAALFASALGWVAAAPARAVPSFTRQTNMPCSACHAAGFFPELNNFGRMFKMNGYVWSAHEDKDYETTPPVAAAQELSFTNVQRSLPGMTRLDSRLPTVGWATDGNNNFSYPQQASFFLAGRFYKRLGGFVMGTYDGADNKWAMDNVDIRLSDVHAFADHHTLLYGVTFNNGPTVQDVWNTLPAWSQLVSSEVAPAPAAAPSIANLAAQVAGVGAYAFWDDFLYAEVTPYVSGHSGVMSFITAGNTKTPTTSGVSPYWRVALYRNRGPHSVSVGGVGLYDRVHQVGASGPSNSFLDLGVDGQYQWNSRPHFVTLRGSFVWENQGLSAAQRAMAAGRSTNDLHTVQVWLSYYYHETAGLTLSFFDVGGTRDHVLYAPGAGDGSRAGKPDSTGGFVQLNLLPFSRWLDTAWPALPMTQFALQYTFYGRFNGARSNYDGFGRSASDNNTLYLLAWIPW